MRHIFLIGLINLVLCMAFSFPAEAKISVGLSSSVLPAKTTQTVLNSLEKELAKSAGTPIQVRLFDNEATVENWLLRFQQVDAAIVSRSFLKQQPAGTLSQLLDLHLTSGKGSLPLVIRQNSGSSLANQVQAGFLKLAESESGLTSLNKLGIAGVTLPGQKFVLKTATKPPVVDKPQIKQEPVKAAPKAVEAAKPEPKSVEKESVPTKAVAKVSQPAAQPEPQPAEKAKSAPVPVVKEKHEAAEVKKLEKPVEPREIAKPAEKQPVASTEKDVEAAKPPIKEPPKPEPQAKEVSAEKAPSKRITLFIVLLIIAAVIIKGILFALKLQGKARSSAPQQTVAIEEPVSKPKTEKVDKPVVDDVDKIIETGSLGPGKVPELLKRCADMPKPVVLKVTKGGSEKTVYFAAGQVSGAYTQNTRAEEGVRWNKLGSLLIREKLITREDRDKGMALVTKESGLRLGEALLKLGLIDLKGLRHALTRQAKVTIYSLILFPEGKYQIIDDASSLPAEESVALEISSLIREASHHQSEWTAIRQTLPNLNKKLEFSVSGREKLGKVNLAPQQEETLALIDGKKTINDLCIQSPMLDYEVYRFLYLMVKTGVLQ